MIKAILQRFRKFKERKAIGNIHDALKDEYGQRKFYRPRQVRKILRYKSPQPELNVLVAYAAFCSHQDFSQLCAFLEINENYSELREPFIPSNDPEGSYDDCEEDFDSSADNAAFDSEVTDFSGYMDIN